MKTADGGIITGMITEGASISGRITNAGAYNGTLTIGYADNNGDSASLSKVTGLFWDIGIAIHPTVEFVLNGEGLITTFSITGGDNFLDNCVLDSGSISEIPGTNLYNFTFTLSACDSPASALGTYTGLATTKDDGGGTDNRLVVQVSNGTHTLNGDFQ